MKGTKLPIVAPSTLPSAGVMAARGMACCQVAVSTADIGRSHWWYRHALGFFAAGERRHREGEHWAAVPGLPEASFDVWCLVGARSFFQIEMFEFARPRPRALPREHNPLDFGYSMIGIHVEDMDEALERIACVGGAPLSKPVGVAGTRRVCLRDPDGILLELMEDRVLPDSESRGSRARGAASVELISVSVRSIEKIKSFWVDMLGLEELHDTRAHHPSHEALWGLDGASRVAILLRGGDVALEFVSYVEPQLRVRPAGYLISDHGILNVALGTTEKCRFDATYERAKAQGFAGHREPWTLPDVASVVYLRDTQGLSVELLHVEPAALERMGFVPNEPEREDANA